MAGSDLDIDSFVNEFEIKLSRSDFAADFREKKHKHHLMSHSVNVHHESQKVMGYVPDRFWFVCPPGVILPEMVSKYAGLAYVTQVERAVYYQGETPNKYTLTIQKQAPRLMQPPISRDRLYSFAQKATQRYWREFARCQDMMAKS